MTRSNPDEVYIVIKVSVPRQSNRLTAALRRAALIEDCPATKKKLRTIADRIANDTKTAKRYNLPVHRPPDDDEIALKRVVAGDAPFPVLSERDAHRAFAAMRDAGVSHSVMAQRLHLHTRTIARWVERCEEENWREI